MGCILAGMEPSQKIDTLSFTTALARQTGELLLEYFRSANLETSLKADRSIVTQADLAADQTIANAIRKQFPRDLLLSEELQTALLPSPEENRAVWVVDPLDGTTNFSLGLHIWGVSIARIVNGWPETAVLYFPRIDELFTAQRGEGAFMNGERLKTTEPAPGQQSAFFTCCSRTFRRYKISLPYKTRILGSASYTLASVARGVALVGFEATPKIWDIASAWLIVSEASGVIQTLDGSRPFPLIYGQSYERQSFPTLAAATHALAGKARLQIQPR